MPDGPMESPAKFIDHTLLKADCTESEIASLCEEAVEYGFSAVCIPPVFVPLAQNLLYGSEVALCTVVGFPLGYHAHRVKAFETARAVGQGATEIDMVIHLGAARQRDFAKVEDDIRGVVAASGTALVKVIIECCLFDDETKSRLAKIVANAGADFVKTSTGFSSGGATIEDVALLSAAVDGRIRVKASAGIRDWPSCQKMMTAGAARIGTSSGVEIMRQWRKDAGL